MSLIGRHVGNYLLTAEIGSGATGEVYLARHPLIGKQVAVKVLRPELSRDPEAVGRFFQEARAVNAINHRNIIDIIDYGQQDDLFYFTMEYLQGCDLAERLADGLSLEDTRTILIQCAQALGVCHQQGIIHRDLKPQNIFIVDEGWRRNRVKLLDFGLAKLTRDGLRVVKTEVGQVFGTPYYMSPEQASGNAELDARADIYSLGVVMYELLTGTLPFDAPTVPETLLAHMVQAPPPPSERNPALPRTLEAICLRALEKDPDRRFQTMEDLQRALEAPASYAGTPSSSGGKPAEPYRRRRATAIRVRRTGEGPVITTQRRSTHFQRRRAAVSLVACSLVLGASAQAWRTWRSRGSVAAPPARSSFISPPPAAPKSQAPAHNDRARDPRVRITSLPMGALVFREGEAIGKTPIVLAVDPARPLEIELRARGYLPVRRILAPAHDQEIELALPRSHPSALKAATNNSAPQPDGLLDPTWIDRQP